MREECRHGLGRAGSSGEAWRSLQPEMGLAEAIHGLDNQDCSRNRPGHGIDHSHGHGGLVAVITGIMWFVTRMARLVVIMGMPLIVMGMAIDRCDINR